MNSKRPNILLLVVDCLRTDHTFGDKRSAQVPHLQALAQNGTLFSDLITANSVTIPCMTTMFSGMYPRSHGVRAMKGFRVGDNVPLLAEILRDNGYHTYAEASGPLNAYFRLDRGFNSYQMRDGVKSSFLKAWGDELISRIKEGALQAPWFLYVHLWEVHQPRQVLPEHDTPQYGNTRYDRAISSFDARLGQLRELLDDNTIVLITGDHGEKIPESNLETQIERFKGPFIKALASKTSPAKRIIRRGIVRGRKAWYSAARLLHRVGLAESPLATVTGHGFHAYDFLVRVPLVVSGHHTPNPGQVIDEQIRQVDIMPTILDLVGLSDKIPAVVDGRSVVPLIEGETLEPLPAFIETCQNTQQVSDLYGVRADGWKYVYHATNPAIPEELYNLRNDPGETKNVAEAYPQKAAEMRALIEQYLQKEPHGGVSLTQDLSEEEMMGLSKRLEQLGYIE